MCLQSANKLLAFGLQLRPLGSSPHVKVMSSSSMQFGRCIGLEDVGHETGLPSRTAKTTGGEDCTDMATKVELCI